MQRLIAALGFKSQTKGIFGTVSTSILVKEESRKVTSLTCTCVRGLSSSWIFMVISNRRSPLSISEHLRSRVDRKAARIKDQDMTRSVLSTSIFASVGRLDDSNSHSTLTMKKEFEHPEAKMRTQKMQAVHSLSHQCRSQQNAYRLRELKYLWTMCPITITQFQPRVIHTRSWKVSKLQIVLRYISGKTGDWSVRTTTSDRHTFTTVRCLKAGPAFLQFSFLRYHPRTEIRSRVMPNYVLWAED